MSYIKNFQDLFRVLDAFEIGLNMASYLPVVQPYSTKIREYYSIAELITGIAITIFSAGLKIQKHSKHFTYQAIGLTLVAHSILNVTRYFVEKHYPFSLFATLPYDGFSFFYLGRRIFSYY